jgi:hypothetical protein
MTSTLLLRSNNAIINSTPSTVFLAVAVYLTNNTAATVIVTRKDPIANVQLGSLQLLPNTAVTIEKAPADTLESTAPIGGSSVAYTT